MQDLDLAIAAARRAAKVITGWWHRLEGADFKGPVDPVTAADREAEAAIVDLLASHRPDDGVLTEEGAGVAGGSNRTWVVDPLDGTVNFLHGIPQVAVSIALEEDGKPVVGVIRDVFRDEEFVAVAGAGARCNDAGIAVSKPEGLHRALVSTGFGYDRRDKAPLYAGMLEAVLAEAQGVRRAGSAALDLAWVACGRLDGHWEFNLSPWDVAAGFHLVREAGGEVLGFGGPADHTGFVAGSPAIAADLLRVVGAVPEVPGSLAR